MATLQNLAQSIEDNFRDGRHFSITKVVRSNDATDRVDVPEGVRAARHVTSVPEDSDDAALTIDSISQQDHPNATQVTVSGGTAGATYFVIVAHNGNAAGL